jgi:hypothetical protein
MNILFISRSWGSSVSIVSYCRLDNRGLILGRGKDFSPSVCVQTCSEAHPAFYPVGTGVLYLAVKCSRGMTLTTHPDLVRGQE